MPKATDLINYTRASSGTALRKISYGDELVASDALYSVTDWVIPAVWSVGSGVATGTSASGSLRYEGFTPVEGKIYIAQFDVTATSGTLYVTIGANYSGQQSTSVSGLKTVIITSGSIVDRGIEFYGGSFSGTIENISVREVLFDQPGGTLTLFNHPPQIPRIEYDTSGNLLGLLVEESRSNLFPYSTPSNTNYIKGSITLTENSAVSPTGETNAGLLTTIATAGVSYAYYNLVSLTTGKATISAYVKEGNHSVFWLYTHSVALYGLVYFDISDSSIQVVAGSSTTPDGGTIEDAGNGWYRISATINISSNNTSGCGVGISDAKGATAVSDGKTGYFYGVQVEQGSFTTSLIPTSGSTVTRSADIASIPVSEFGYNQNQGTLFVEAKQYENSTSVSRFAMLWGGGTGDGGSLSLGIYANSTWLETYNGNVSNLYDVRISGERQKIASGFDPTGNALVGDGSILGTPSTSGLVNPINVTDLYIGFLFGGSQQANGHIKSIKYWPKRLSNAQLQELTS